MKNEDFLMKIMLFVPEMSVLVLATHLEHETHLKNA